MASCRRPSRACTWPRFIQAKAHSGEISVAIWNSSAATVSSESFLAISMAAAPRTKWRRASSKVPVAGGRWADGCGAWAMGAEEDAGTGWGGWADGAAAVATGVGSLRLGMVDDPEGAAAQPTRMAQASRTEVGRA